MKKLFIFLGLLVSIAANATLGVTITSITNVTCHGATTGNATATATSGTSPYTYSWSTSPSQTSAEAMSLSAGTYTVVVTDHAAATASVSVTITQPTALSSSTTIYEVSYTNANNGKVISTPAGGTSPYTYSWSTGATIDSIYNLPIGTYTVTVTDNHGCTTSIPSTVSQPGSGTVFPWNKIISDTLQVTGKANQKEVSQIAQKAQADSIFFSGGVSGGITGSGYANYIPVFTGTFPYTSPTQSVTIQDVSYGEAYATEVLGLHIGLDQGTNEANSDFFVADSLSAFELNPFPTNSHHYYYSQFIPIPRYNDTIMGIQETHKGSTGAFFGFTDSTASTTGGTERMTMFVQPKGQSGDAFIATPKTSGTLAEIAQLNVGQFGKPTLSAGAGAGSGSPAVSDTGTNLSGTLVVTTGSTPTGSNAKIVTATFTIAFTNGSSVLLIPANANAAGLATALLDVYVNSSKSQFILYSGTSGLTGSTTYVWKYIITGF